jgi:hypothetical protein
MSEVDSGIAFGRGLSFKRVGKESYLAGACSQKVTITVKRVQNDLKFMMLKVSLRYIFVNDKSCFQYYEKK